MPIQVGIMGLGRSGWGIHASTLKNLAGYRVAAVADPEESRRHEATEAFGCRAYPTPEEMVHDPDVEVVVIATPSFTHVPLAQAALRAGKHVIVEKPMAEHAAEVDGLIEEANRAGRLLTGFQNRRYDADFMKVREIIASGVLGPVHLAKLSRHSFSRRNDWQTLRKFGGGQLGNWGAHVLDHALLLLGSEIRDLFADLQNTVSAGDAEDHVKVVIRGQNGMVVDAEITNGSAYPQPEWQILGKYGSLVGRGRRIELQYYSPADLPPLEAEEGPAKNRAYGSGETIPWHKESIEVEPSDANAAWYHDFERALRAGEPAPVSPESIRRLIALMETVRESAGTG